METAQPVAEGATRPGRLRRILGQYNWRMMLMRVLINGLTLLLVAGLVPDIYFPTKRLYSLLVMALVLGVLNFLVKPIIQWITLPFIFATYGFVVILINTIILLGLSWVSEFFDLNFFYVGGLLWAIVGGLVMGAISSLLESLFGLNIPVSTQSEVVQSVSGSRAAHPRTLMDLVEDEVSEGEEASDVDNSDEDAAEVDTSGDQDSPDESQGGTQ